MLAALGFIVQEQLIDSNIRPFPFVKGTLFNLLARSLQRFGIALSFSALHRISFGGILEVALWNLEFRVQLPTCCSKPSVVPWDSYIFVMTQPSVVLC